MIDLDFEIEKFLNDYYSTDKSKICTYRISDCGPPWIGAMLSHMVFASNVSYSTGHSISISSHGGWEMVPNGKFSDVFNSIPIVDDKDFEVNNFYNANTRISYNYKKTEGFDIHFSPEVAYFYPKELENIVGTVDKYVLSDIWKSFLLKKIYSLSEKYQEYLSQRIEKFKNLKNYAAIHIRRGDKVSGRLKESNYISVNQYFNSLENTNYEFESIFVSTDSQDALSECIDLYGSKYELIYDDSEIRHDGYPLKIRDNVLDIQETSHEELITALKNFYILKNSKVLVGSPASWFFRISMLLRPYSKIKDVVYSENLSEIPGYPNAYYHC